MAQFARRNAWLNGGTFANDDLLWYAKGVGVMQSRSLNDTGSWWFFGAIHGVRLSAPILPGWNQITAPPNVPTSPLPSPAIQRQYWKQCQHQTWFFAPWHRGYLIALEAQLRAAILSLGGPATWALPYWNYFGPDDQHEMPPAFAELNLPDGSKNPLFVTDRHGPHHDGNIFVPIPPVSEDCLGDTIFTGANSVTTLPGFGGPDTGFMHSGTTSGHLEDNPHNLVHSYVGGAGLMSYPDTAALDPIFYLHHCNIDRLWGSWNDRGNVNPSNNKWLAGPTAAGDPKFVMPMPGGTAWQYSPADVMELAKLDYAYDDLSVGPSIHPQAKLFQRLVMLGVAPAAATKKAGEDMEVQGNAELLGASSRDIPVKSSGARATVKLSPDPLGRVNQSLMDAPQAQSPDRVYLELQNVTGNDDAFVLDLSVNQHKVGSVSLFGLENASSQDGKHGGSGLTFLFDITEIVDQIFLSKGLDLDSLEVRITPNRSLPDGAALSIGRISVYRTPDK